MKTILKLSVLLLTTAFFGCGGIGNSSTTSSSSSTSSSTTSSSSSASSSSNSSSSAASSSSGAMIISPLGHLNCNASISENWPCSFNPEAKRMCGCSFTTCGCARRPPGTDPSLAWSEDICWLGEHEPCDERDDKGFTACSSGLCGTSSYSSSSTSSSSGSSVSSSSSSGSASDLAVNGSMENGAEYWIAVGEAAISQSDILAHQDTYSLLVLRSDNSANAVSQTISGFSSHRIYEISAAVRMAEQESSNEPAAIAVDADGKKLAVNNHVPAENWGNLNGFFKPERGQSAYTFQFYGLQPNTGFYLDSVSVVARRRTTEIEAIATGRMNFVSKGCVNCHGNDPTNTEAAKPIDPFNLKKTTRSDLARYIYFNMPQDSPEDCVTDCAISIAAYILSWDEVQ